jgi:hypothetical protein
MGRSEAAVLCRRPAVTTNRRPRGPRDTARLALGARRRSARALGGPADGPAPGSVHARGGGGPDRRDRTLGRTGALAAARDGPRRPRRHLRERRVPVPGDPGHPRPRGRRRAAGGRRPVDPGPARLGRAGPIRRPTRPAAVGPRATHLAAEDDGRRYQAARHLADLFDRYAVHRPEMVRAWSSGDDVGPDLAPIGAGHAWQPPAWRALREDARRAQHRGAARPRRAPPGRRRGRPRPARAAVGVRAVRPAGQLPRGPGGLAGPRDVHLFLRHPSPVLWERVAALHRDEPPHRGPRAADPTAELPHHPLLRSWGRDAREMQTVFAALGAPPAPSAGPTPDDAARGGGRRRRRCCTVCRPTCGRTGGRPAHRQAVPATAARGWTPPTVRSRCTPPTAACGRSRSCATRSCTCSPTP